MADNRFNSAQQAVARLSSEVGDQWQIEAEANCFLTCFPDRLNPEFTIRS